MLVMLGISGCCWVMLVMLEVMRFRFRLSPTCEEPGTSQASERTLEGTLQVCITFPPRAGGGGLDGLDN